MKYILKYYDRNRENVLYNIVLNVNIKEIEIKIINSVMGKWRGKMYSDIEGDQ